MRHSTSFALTLSPSAGCDRKTGPSPGFWSWVIELSTDVVNLPLRKTFEDFLQHDSALEPSKRLPKTEMCAKSERKNRPATPKHIEAVGLRELRSSRLAEEMMKASALPFGTTAPWISMS